MKQGSTLILKGVLILVSVIVLAIAIFLIPKFGSGFAFEYPSLAHLKYVVVTVLYATTIPFFSALYWAFSLLNYIDSNTAFSDKSVTALKNIKYCGIAISVLYILTLPIFYYVAQIEDAPGLVIIGMLIAAVPMVIATFAAVLQKLLKNAIDIKTENELTV